MAARPCVGVACSGGRDSLALLHATVKQARCLGLHVAALHVHHGLQPAADAWWQRLQRLCGRWARAGAPVSFHGRRLRDAPAAGDSVEAWARRERYRALGELAAEAGATLVLLAHHQGDQAETFLLQALRGGGAAGLAAMPRSVQRDGLCWARPWLDQPRDRIEAYVRRHGLRPVEDPSNADARFDRNRLRLQLMPALDAAFPGARAALSQAAERAQEDAQCLQELAAADLQRVQHDGEGLDLQALATLSSARRANLLRAWLRMHGEPPQQALIVRLQHELFAGSTPARWAATSGELGRYRGRLRYHVKPTATDAAAGQRFACHAPGRYPLPAGAGWLEVQPVAAGGIDAGWLAEGLDLRTRTGGERFQFEPRSVPRALKKQYQALGVPAWQREGPLLYRGPLLVFVPRLGIDARAAAPAGRPQFALQWQPGAAA